LTSRSNFHRLRQIVNCPQAQDGEDSAGFHGPPERGGRSDVESGIE